MSASIDEGARRLGLFALLEDGLDETWRNFGCLVPRALAMGLVSAIWVSGCYGVAGLSLIWAMPEASSSSLARLTGGALALGLAGLAFGQIWAWTVVGAAVAREMRGGSSNVGPSGALYGAATILAARLLVAVSAPWLIAGGATVAVFGLAYRYGVIPSVLVSLFGVLAALVALAGAGTRAVRFSLAPYAMAGHPGGAVFAMARSAARAPRVRWTALALVVVGGSLTMLAYGFGFVFVDVTPFELASRVELGTALPGLLRTQITGTFISEVPLAAVRTFLAVCGVKLYDAAERLALSVRNHGEADLVP